MFRGSNLFSCFIFLIFCIPIVGKANIKEDRIKEIDSLNLVGWDFVFNDPEFTITQANNQIQLSQEVKYYNGIINAYYQKGHAYKELKIFDEAIKYYFEALDILESYPLPNYSNKKLQTLKSLGYAYEKTYGFSTARQYYEDALQVALQMNDSSEISSLKYNIGISYERDGKYTKALELFNQSLTYVLQTDHQRLAKIYNGIGNTNSYLKEFEVANQYYRKALEINSESYQTVSNIGDNYYDQGVYDSAIFYYTSALQLSIKNNDQEKTIWIKNNLGDVYFSKGDYQHAISYYSQSFKDLDSSVIDTEYRRSCEKLSASYELLGDYKNALLFHGLYVKQSELLASVKDKLLEQNSIYRMKEMEWQLERKAKDEKLALSRTIIFWLKTASIALVLVLLVSVYKAIRYYRGIRQVKRWLATE